MTTGKHLSSSLLKSSANGLIEASREALQLARELLPTGLKVLQGPGHTQGSDRVGEEVEYEEGADGADVNAADRRDDTAEEVETAQGGGG